MVAHVGAVAEQKKQQVRVSITAGHFKKALKECKGLVKKVPNDPEAWFLLGGIYGQLSNLVQAEEALRKAVGITPKAVPALVNLGLVLFRQHRQKEAEEFLARAEQLSPNAQNIRLQYAEVLLSGDRPDAALTKLDAALAEQPGNIAAKYLRALALTRLGKKLEAQAQLVEITGSQPNFWQAWKELGRIHLSSQLYQDAERALAQGLQHNGDDAELNFLAGITFDAAGNIENSIIAFSKAITLNPELREPYQHLAKAYRKQGLPMKSVEVLRNLLGKIPDDIDILSSLAGAYQAAGELEPAIRTCEQILRLSPGHEGAVAGLAYAHLTNGDKVRAQQLVRPIIEQGSNNSHIASVYAKLASNDAELCCAEAILRKIDREVELDTGSLMQLQFSLGDVYDRLGRQDEAFDYYSKANGHSDTAFSTTAHTDSVNRIIDNYSNAAIKQQTRASNISRSPAFIVGMPRSGTSLIEQILASHSQVHGAGELETINEIAYAAGTGEPMDPSQLNRYAERYLSQSSSLGGGARIVTDKMPTNFLHLGLVSQILPGAKVIHCCRSALDTCLSCYFHHFSGRHDYASNLADLGNYFQQYAKLMKHWHHVLPLQILRVEYEKLVRNPEEEIRRMIAFLDLDWEPGCLNFSESKRITKTASYEQVTRPIYSSSVGRSRNYAAHLAPLIDALGEELILDACVMR